MIRISQKINANSTFRANPANNQPKKSDNDANPISERGEQAILIKGTVLAGLGFGLRALYYFFEDGFIIDKTDELSDKIVKAHGKGLSKNALLLMKIGASVGLIGGFVLICAAAYTAYKTPEIKYKSKINSHVKGKDMDLYIKGNMVEKELYKQMHDKAQNTTKEEKRELAKGYLKLKAAKNQIPDSIIKGKKDKNENILTK